MLINRKHLMASVITGCIALSTYHNGVAQSKKEEILLQQTSEVNNLMVQYNADRGSLSRFYAVPWSPEKRERFVKFHQEYLRKLEALPFDQFSIGSRVDYILFKRNLDNQLRLLATEAKGYEAISRFIPFAPAIWELEKQRRRGVSQDGKKLAADMFHWQQQIRQSMQQLQQEPEMDMALAEMASGAARGLQQALRSVFDFYYGYDPGFTWWVEKPYRTTDSLLNAYSGQLKLKGKITTTQKDDGSGIIGKPIGREELIRQLQYEMIPYTPEDLIAMANREFAWCHQEMLKASREMGFGDDWKKAMEVVKNSYVPEGKQPELILRLFNESVDFLKKNDLVTIPPLAEETWRMTMMSPQQQLVSPFFLGGETILIAYPTNTMEEDDKLMSMRGNNPHFSRAVVHHELIAGHHLQGFMGNRFKAYREFDTPFWTEGWALYQEFILWDLKFPQSAADRIGMLFWRMHRCARIIFSLNYHLGNWTPQQCIDFLVEQVNHERANAAGEVRRSFTGGYGPLYQLAYMVGGQQFYALKKELVDTGKMSFKEFHDAVLRENGMPVEMVRAILIQQQLKKDFVTGWKFYGK